MKQITTLTSKGQVTIPKEIRDELGLRPHDKIRFFIVDGKVGLEKAYPSLEDVAGSLPASGVPMEEWDRIIQDERAREYVKKFR